MQEIFRWVLWVGWVGWAWLSEELKEEIPAWWRSVQTGPLLNENLELHSASTLPAMHTLMCTGCIFSPADIIRTVVRRLHYWLYPVAQEGTHARPIWSMSFFPSFLFDFIQLIQNEYNHQSLPQCIDFYRGPTIPPQFLFLVTCLSVTVIQADSYNSFPLIRKLSVSFLHQMSSFELTPSLSV